MGGATSEVAGDTIDVLLESASFTRTGILRTARRLDLHTEASHRFERGTDPEALEAGAARGAQLMAAWTGGSVARGIAEDGDTPPDAGCRCVRRARRRCSATRSLAPTSRRSFDRLAMTHRASDAGGVEQRSRSRCPGYRVDIDREVDLIEEVARLLGYDRIGVARAGRPDRPAVSPRPTASAARAVDALVRRRAPRGAAAHVRLGRRPRVERDTTRPCPSRTPCRPTRGSCAPGCCPGSCTRSRATRPEACAQVAIFEAGTVFRLDGDAVDGTPARRVRAAGPGRPKRGTPTPAPSTPSTPRACSAR